jgi:hypothetical protein
VFLKHLKFSFSPGYAEQTARGKTECQSDIIRCQLCVRAHQPTSYNNSMRHEGAFVAIKGEVGLPSVFLFPDEVAEELHA